MTEDRLWIIKASLLVLGLSFGFFVVARPVFDFPMLYEETIRVMQIIFPVFVGYLGAGAVYVTQRGTSFEQTSDTGTSEFEIARLLLRGPLYLASAGLALLIASFWLSNRASVNAGSGMSMDNFCWFLSLLMALLSASTALIVARIFPSTSKRSKKGAS